MKKGYKVLAALVVLMLVITGCSSNNGNGNGNGDTDGGGDEVVTLQVYQIGDAPKNIDELTDEINAISEEEIGVNVKFNYIGWGDYGEKMGVMVSAGDEFDIAFADNFTVNAQKDAYADLTDLIDEHATGFFDSIDDIYYDGNVVNEKVYSFPVNGNVFAQQMLSFNGEMLDKHDLDVSNVNSYGDALDHLKVIKENEPETVPFAIGKEFKATLGNFDYILGDALPFAINMDGDSSKIVNAYDTEEGMAVLNDMRMLFEEKVIPADAATSSTSYDLGSNTWFMREETQGPADYGDSLLSQVAGKEIISRPINEGLKSTAQARQANFIVAQNSKNKEASVKWLNLLNTNEQMMNTLIYGIEGDAWEKVDDDHLELLDGYKDGYHMAAWNTGNSEILLQPESVTDEMIAQREVDTEEAIVSPALGFNFVTDNVKTEISNLMNVMDEYSAVLNTGTVDPNEKVPEFIEKLESAGWNEVIEEMQNQYDEFQASQD